MNKQVKRALCIESVYSIASNTIESSGRYIKALRHSYGLTVNENEKIKYEYKITRSLQKHIMLLQENIIKNSGRMPNKKINTTIAKNIIHLTNSPIALNEGKFSYVDVDSLRNIKLLDKSVVVKKDIVLPVKVKANKYKFNAQIILSKNNILSYASNTLQNEEINDKLYVPKKIVKLGAGIKNNEIIENTKKVSKER